ncbi:MAG TPA: PKD domain-containing protein [Actinocrinis sp.]|uniref:PKD domain-containing protein n=1 Tax=Actinocrinis sp. TaxID=1920516 RepID=UPI002DDCFE0B|nr:PKD domain-containing protein [Actinocrinis sp.]HEV2345541.1 PKD domain-containing protein [Actinocrinis sp.]
MRPRIVAASAAALIAAASFAPTAARAVGQNAIFVNNSTSACTDSGTGTLAAPYCTLQVAADAANPGDVVDVTPGTYAAATITRSGTASAPITFTGNGVWLSFGVGRAASAPLSISGASYLKIVDFRLAPGSAADAVVSGGSNITFDNDNFNPPTSAAAVEPALHITNAASAVTVRDSILSSGVLVDGGSTGTVVTTNRIGAGFTSPVSVVGATNTAITSNTINGCGPSISITGSAAGTSVENNVISSPETAGNSSCPASSQAYGMLVDSSSTSTTTADYNDVYASGAGAAPYDWAGTAYSSGAGLYTAAGQAQHDDNTVLGTQVTEHSPLIDSANSAAVGEQAVDITGNPRVSDPLVTQTGAGPSNDYDRGAAEFEDPLSIVTATFAPSVNKAPVGAAITLHAAVTDTWSDTFDYRFSLSTGTVDSGTGGTASVSFSTPGSYSATLYVIPQNRASAPMIFEGSVVLTIVPQAPLTPQISVAASGAYGVSVSDFGTTDAWNVSGVTFDFGDKTPVQTAADGATVQHAYAKAGTYPITETVTDQGGNSATTSTTFTTNALVPGTLINMGGGLTTFIPAKSTGIAQAAVTSMPNDGSQLVAATTGGTVEFATGTSHGNTWQAWQPLSQPGVTVKWVGIAGMPNGSSQLIEVTSAGTLLHTVHNANGTWQAGWGSPAGSTGFTHASITAMPDGSTQLVAVTTAGVLMHNIRFANGSWQGWRALGQSGVKIVDASIAGLPDGSSQIVEATSTGVMQHDIRFPDGHWQGWGVPAGATGITQVSIASTSVFGSPWSPGATIISVVTSQGGMMNVFRNSGGSWSDWTGTRSGIGDLGTVANTTVSTLPDGGYLMFSVSGG